MMRPHPGAVLTALQLLVVGVLSQGSSDDIASCYTHCRNRIQDAVEGWDCPGNQECNCRTEGYLERLGCCIQDRCRTSSQAAFRIPCSPDDDDDEIFFREASCPADFDEDEDEENTTTRRVGVNAITSTPSASSSTTTSEASSTTEQAQETTTNSSNAPPSDQESDTDDGGNNTLTLGLGLGLGIPLALSLAGLLAFILLRRRRKNNKNKDNPSSNEDLSSEDKNNENPFNSPIPPPASIYELSTSPRAEPTPPNELPDHAYITAQRNSTRSPSATSHLSSTPSRSTSDAGSYHTAGIAPVSRKSRETMNSASRRSAYPSHETLGARANSQRPSRETLGSMISRSHGTPPVGGGGGGGHSRSNSGGGASRHSRSHSQRGSISSKRLMRDLPEIPPAVAQAPSPRIGPISELP